MKKVFLDSSVIFAGIVSETGASRVILDLSESKKIESYISSIIVEEVLRNLKKKFGEKLVIDFLRFLSKSNFKKIEFENEEEILQYASYTAKKDAHVIAGAYKSAASYLISLDKKHILPLMIEGVTTQSFPFKIMPPSEFLNRHLTT